MEPYESLANAIIVQAVKDYREAIRFLKHHPHTSDLDTEGAKKDMRMSTLRNKVIKNEGIQNDVECFFRSGWFGTLSVLDGEVLLIKVRKMEMD